VEQELTTLPEHLSSPPFLVGFVLLDLLLIIIQRLNGKEITLDIVVKYIASFLGVGQGMKQTYVYMWYPLFQAQWDRCDQQNHQT
jgi:hypothetical protein